MSNQVFNARLDLLASLTTEDPTIFTVEFNVFDGTGQFGAEGVQVGDSVFLDTYIANSTISKYKVHLILGYAGSYFNGQIKYVDTGDVVDPGVLSMGPGAANGFVCRPSMAHRFSWFSAPTVHTFYDYITQYARDMEHWAIIDEMSATGPQGVQGITGLGTTGLAGVDGVTGLAGVAGVAGVTGLAGVAGANGETGLAGVAGVAGVTGLAGVAGANGETGLAGVAGANGATGLAGVAGANGATGLAGVAGANGATGLAGVAGANGATGLAGVAGANGATGLAGVAGANGATGLAGVAGANGATGLAGVAGANGATGLAGVAGVAGVTGLAGVAGVAGVTGLAGVAGANGATGLAGVAGVAGVTGLAGVAGSVGATGFAGAQGETGFGEQGVTGVVPGGGEGVRTLTFDSGNVIVRAAGVLADVTSVTATKDYSVAAVSRLLLSVPAGVEVLEVHCTFTAAQTAGRTEVRLELPDPSGSSVLSTSYRPFAIKLNSIYGIAGTNSTISNVSGTLVVVFTAYTGGTEQKMSMWV